MTDHRPICPIPPDAKKGDFIVLRDGQRRKIGDLFDGQHWPLEGFNPGYVRPDGSAFAGEEGWEVVAFEYADGRKPNLLSTAKPKRTQAQRDAAWLRYLTMLLAFKPSEYKRLKQIANRLEKQQ